ncbi:MAG TPA: FprA family A-type flavoprotein [Thermoprotei archaeon]|nr:FprA family A-type flavoprotein [Thermoprotei archaeon]
MRSKFMASYIIRNVSKSVTLLRLNDTDVKYFEANWHIPEGITYNAYVIKGKDGAVLIDLWKQKYSDLFLEALKQVVEPAEIRYVVVNHAEPDHTGALEAFSEVNPNAIVVAFPIAESLLRAKYNFKNQFKSLKNDESLSLSDITLKFIYTPWVHWPETMMTYYEQERILFTCDAFGSYSIPDGVDDQVADKEYERYSEKYLVTVIGSYRDNLLKNIEKLNLEGIKPAIIAPSHGLIWSKNPERVIQLYTRWARGESDEKKAVIIYASMYGSIESVVKKIKDSLPGVNFKTFAFTDNKRDDIEDALTEANGAKVVVIASPTYEVGPHPSIAQLIDIFSMKMKGLNKPTVLLTSYGWSSTADKRNLKAMQDAGFKVIDQATFKEKIAENDLKRIVSSISAALSSQP